MKPIRAVLLSATCAAAAAGCGGGNTATAPTTGSNAPGQSAAASVCPAALSGTTGNGAHVSIGSKAFAEEQLLATMTKLVLEAHGFTVDYTLQAKDTAIGDALTGGQIDMLWQYTGTELTDYLKLKAGDFPKDLTGAFTAVQQKDLARNICWTAPAPMNDTNGMAIRSSDTGRYGTSLTSFGTYLAAHPETKVCIQSEFRTRGDGLPGLESNYNPAYGQAALTDISSTAEKQIASGECDAGEVFTTDSTIVANNLVVLSDDKNFFPPDNVGLMVRADTLTRYPAIAALMTPVAAKITSSEITKLNKAVEIDNQNVTTVAKGWLQQNGFL